MADDLELTELRLEVKLLRGEIERLKEKSSHMSRLRIAFAFLFALSIPMVVAYWAPKLGMGPDSGKFSSVDVNGTVNLERIRLEDNSRMGVETRGAIETDRPNIRLRSSEGEAINIDADRISLEGKRGELILELNEKGEPVLRSVPKVEKK